MPVPDLETDRKVTELNERLDQFAARLDSIAQKLDDTVTAAARPVNDGSSVDIAAMESMIGRLESKINALEKQKTVSSAAASPTSRAAPKKSATPTAPKRSTQPKSAQHRVIQWDLRGASPHKAYVAERGTQNVRTVSVGDTLPGIGRITAITQQQTGHWVVHGVNGRITQ